MTNLRNFSCMFISILCVFLAAMCPSSIELLYQCDMWFMSLCVDDRLVCRYAFHPNLHTRRSSTQSDINQMSHCYTKYPEDRHMLLETCRE